MMLRAEEQGTLAGMDLLEMLLMDSSHPFKDLLWPPVVVLGTLPSKKQINQVHRTLDGGDEGSSYLEFTTADGGYSKSWLSFLQDGEVGPDDRDAFKLMPLMASSRLVSLTHSGENSLDINNLPFEYEGMISIPLDVMSLSLEE